MKRNTLVSLALLAGLAIGCGEVLQPRYSIVILGPSGQNPFFDATNVALEIGGVQRVIKTVTPGEPFRLSLEGIHPQPSEVETIGITAYNAAGVPVAHGQSPPIEIIASPSSLTIQIFVQRYGTYAPGFGGLDAGLRYLSATSLSASSSGNTVANVPFFFGGEYFIYKQDGTFFATGVSPYAFPFNPARHSFGFDLTGQSLFDAVSVAPRFGAAMVTTSTGSAIAFGGQTADMTAPFSSIAESFTLARVPPVDIVVQNGAPMTTTDATAARAFAAMAEAGMVYAFGGIGRGPDGKTIALDSIVRIDPNAQTPTAAITVLPTRMAASRMGLTASSTLTMASNGAKPAVLIFGGLEPNSTAPAAELFVPDSPSMPLAGEGGNRIAHNAISHNGRILIIGGANSDGTVRGDVVSYTPTTGTFGLEAFALAVPRRDATAFIAGNDLVVAGGRDQAGTPITTVEIFDLSTSPISALPTQTGGARFGATATAMPDGKSFIIVGGTQKPAADEFPSALVEFYRPRL